MAALQFGHRIAGRADGHVHVPVHVVQDRFDDGLPARQEQVLCVGPAGAGPLSSALA